MRNALSFLCLFGALVGCAHQRNISSVTMGTDIASATSSVPKDEVPPETLRAQGVEAYTSGDFPRAGTLLQTAFAMDPQFQEPWPRFLIFYSLLITGDYPRALTVAEMLANELPYQPLVYQQLGLAHLGLGNAAAAINAFSKALDFDSHAPRVHFYMALAQAQLGKNKDRDRSFLEAQREYQDILRFNPKDFSANYELASLFLFRNMKVEEVGQLLQNCREGMSALTQEELPVQRKLYSSFYLPLLEGIYAFRKGDNELAVSRLSGALAHLPSGVKADAAEVYYYLGKVHEGMKHNPEVQAMMEEAVSLDPKGIYAKEAQGIIRALAAQKSTPP